MNSRNRTFALLFLVLLLYFLFRTINLTLLPIFNDESTYIRYGLHQLNEQNHQPYSLLIGKEPLMPYLYAVFGSASGNLLVGSRWVTILFGLLTLTGLFLFTKSLMGKTAALFASIFYCIAPFTVFFDRLALLDSPVSTIAVWSLYVTHQLLKKSLWWYAIGLGAITGIGMWMKTSDLFYLCLPLISYAIYFFAKGDKEFVKGRMFVTAFFLALIIYLPLFSNPFYSVHMQLMQQYTYPIYSVFFFPFAVWWNNFASTFEWLFFYLTPPLFLLALVTLIIITKQKKFFLISLWFYMPLLYEVLYAKLFASRHVLLLTIPLFIAAGYGFAYLWKKKWVWALVLGACIIAWTIFYDGVLVTNPQQYPSLFPGRAMGDMNEYVHGFSSGYGVAEAVTYLDQLAATQRIVVLIRNDHGNPEDAMVAYFDYKPNILLGPMNVPTADVPQVFQQVGTTTPVYFVTRGSYNAGLEKYFASEVKFNKPNDTEYVGVARLQPSK